MSNGTSSWNRPHESVKSEAGRAKKAPSAMRGIVAGIVVIVAFGTLCYLLFFGGGDAPKANPDRGRGRIKDAAHYCAKTNHLVQVEKKVEMSTDQAPTCTIIRARTPSDGRVMTLMDGTVITNRTKVIFKRDFERTLSVALRPGSMSSSLITRIRNRYNDDQIVAMLKEMTVPADDDDETTARIKRKVQDLKEQMLLQIADGRSVSDVLEDVRSQRAFENRLKVNAMRIRKEALRTHDAETVRKAFEMSNKVLEENGLPTTKVPERYRTTDKEGNPASDVSADGVGVNGDSQQVNPGQND